MALEFSRMGAMIVLGGLTGAILAGCSSATSSAVAPEINRGANRSATYPDITARVSAATTQRSNDEAAAISGRLSALGAHRQAGTITEAEYRRQMLELQALAANHGADTLKEIEN
ncbi:MAG TPA: SHOCT domain-containing protein [Mycoplana sp.]|nr:SHOCT domain-containing protein [Mycoplana sp.]